MSKKEIIKEGEFKVSKYMDYKGERYVLDSNIGKPTQIDSYDLGYVLRTLKESVAAYCDEIEWVSKLRKIILQRNKPPSVAFCIDTSSSMKTTHTEEMLKGIDSVKELVNQTDSWTIEFDCGVQTVTPINKKITKLTGRGGTDYACCVQRAVDMEADICVIFTDGIGNFGNKIALKRKIEIVWVLNATNLDEDLLFTNTGTIIMFRHGGVTDP